MAIITKGVIMVKMVLKYAGGEVRYFKSHFMNTKNKISFLTCKISLTLFDTGSAHLIDMVRMHGEFPSHYILKQMKGKVSRNQEFSFVWIHWH